MGPYTKTHAGGGDDWHVRDASGRPIALVGSELLSDVLMHWLLVGCMSYTPPKYAPSQKYEPDGRPCDRKPGLFVVVGTTGEHADKRRWNVVAYRDRHTAEVHCAKANEAVKGAEKNRRQHTAGFANPYDPFCQVDYTGTEYEVEELAGCDLLSAWDPAAKTWKPL